MSKKKTDNKKTPIQKNPEAAFTPAALSEIISSEDYFVQKYPDLKDHSELMIEAAASELHWFRSWKKIREGKLFKSKWFRGGKINLSYNCLDRHINDGRKNKAALIWEGENGETSVLTYLMLLKKVEKMSKALLNAGITKGDTVTIFMGSTPEFVIASLACVRIGTLQCIVSPASGANALRECIIGSASKLVITEDVMLRRGQKINIKTVVDEAIADANEVKKVIVSSRFNDHNCEMVPGRDVFMEELTAFADDDSPAAGLDSNHPFLISFLYNGNAALCSYELSHGGFATQTYLTAKILYNIDDNDIYWCTVDTGTLCGVAYSIYAPLLNAATLLLYEGVPNYPNPDRYWEIITKYKVSIFITTPTFVRAARDWGESWLKRYNFDSLRIISSIDDELSDENREWFINNIGGGKIPLVDCFFNSESGATLFFSYLKNKKELKNVRLVPLPFINFTVSDKHGNTSAATETGILTLTDSWPSKPLLTVKGDDKDSSAQKNFYTNDVVIYDPEKGISVPGRFDNVVKVAGYRISISYIKNILLEHADVEDAEVVTRPDKIKGKAIVGFVRLKNPGTESILLKEELRDHVMSRAGLTAKPDEIKFLVKFPLTDLMKKDIRELYRLALNGNGDEKNDNAFLLKQFSPL